MNYCSYCDIAYEEKNCPLCVAKEEIEGLRKELDTAQDDIAKLERGK